MFLQKPQNGLVRAARRIAAHGYDVLLHMAVDERPDFLQGEGGVVPFGQQQGEIVRHAGVDGQGHFGAVGCSFFGKCLVFRQENLVATGLDEHGWQTAEVSVQRRETGIFSRQCARVSGIADRFVERRAFAENLILRCIRRARDEIAFQACP